MAKTMKSWIVSETSGFNGLKFVDVPIPEIGDKDVLVKCMELFFP